MNGSHALAPIPLIFLGAGCFACGGWYYFFNTRKICDQIAAMGRPRFLAKAYSGKFTYCLYKASGVVSFMVSLLLLGAAVMRLLNIQISN